MEGCILTTTSAVLPSDTTIPIPFDSELQFGAQSFFDIGSPTLIQPPAAFNGDFIEYFGCIATNFGGNGTDGNHRVRLNGSAELTGFQYDNLPYGPFAGRTGVVEFTTADTVDMIYRTFGPTGSAILPYIKLGCIVNPDEHLLGMTTAYATTQSVASLVALTWQTPIMDTVSAFDAGAPTLFTAPEGAVAAVVTCYGHTVPGSVNDIIWRLDKNLTTIREARYRAQFRLGWGGTWLVDIAENDTIRVQVEGANSTEATPNPCVVCIEWYG